MAFGGSRIVAPSIAGFVIAAAGAPAVFLLSTIGISTMIAVLFLVRPGTRTARSHGGLLDNLADSVRYIRENEVFSKVIVAALLNAAFAMGYIHMLPVFAKAVLGVDSRGLGLLASAAGMGALCGLFSYPWLQARTTPRNAIVYALTAYCCALIGVALSGWFWVSFVLLLAVGLSQAYFMTSCQVILQTLVDEQYRGRVMGMFTLVWSLVYLSGFLLNFAGSLTGPSHGARRWRGHRAELRVVVPGQECRASESGAGAEIILGRVGALNCAILQGRNGSCNCSPSGSTSPKRPTSFSGRRISSRPWKTCTRRWWARCRASSSAWRSARPRASAWCAARAPTRRMVELAKKNALALGAGHSFIVFLGDGFFPVNVLNALKMVPEVCRIFCATANPTEVVIAQTEQGRGILGVVDGASPKGVEAEADVAWRKDLLRQIGYKL